MTSRTPLPALLLFAAATHFLVDLTAGMLSPLWPRLDGHFHLAAWQSAALFFIWQMTTSLSQFFFGWLGDRFPSRWLLWAGPLAGIVCLGAIGLTASATALALLLTVAGLGVAAYHPEAAALAGGCAPEDRSRAMSVFFMGGFLGQAIGPIYSGKLVDTLGLAGLTWTILAGLVMAALLAPLGKNALQHLPSQHRRVRLRDALSGRWSLLTLVLFVGSLRIIAAGGVPVLLGYLLESRHATATETGALQSVFMLGIGLGGLTCATIVRHHHERLILWLCPLMVTPVLVAIPWASAWPLALAVGISGMLLGISLPVLISYGQQVMPESQRIASSLTMGVSWGLGGGIVSLILAACRSAGRYEPAFLTFAVATAVSSLLCLWLPVLHTAQQQELSTKLWDRESVPRS